MVGNPYEKGANKLFVLFNLIFGLYFLNVPFQFVKVPESFSVADPWIIFVGGILIILGTISYFRIDRKIY